MSTKEVVWVPVAEIEPDPDQPRRRFSEESLRELGATYAERQIDPVHVRRCGTGFRLIHGQRRWMAAKLVGLASIPCLIRDGESDEAARLEEQLISNMQREDLNPIDAANSIARLLRVTGRPASVVSRRLGTSEGRVSKLLTLLLLPSELQEKVASGAIAGSTAYEIAKVGDAAERERLAQEALAGTLTRDRAAQRTRSLARGVPQRSKRIRRRLPRVVLRLGHGRSVTVMAPELSLSAVAAVIDELLHLITDASSGGLALDDLTRQLSGKD
jgi:ParB family transcriptional regulator, chromosome partitioning protein